MGLILLLAACAQTPETIPSATEADPAGRVVQEFVQALSAGDAGRALGFWYLQAQDQPANYAETVREAVSRWADGSHQFQIGQVTYSGMVAPHQVEPLDWKDPRAEFATVDLQIDETDVHLRMVRKEGRWWIEAWAIADYLAQPGWLYLLDGNVYRAHENEPLGRIPEDAGHLALGPDGMAYTSGSQLRSLNFRDGSSAVLKDFGERPGLDFSLRWSDDGSALAYAAAWDQADGSRKVELGTAEGQQAAEVAVFTARAAGPTPTPPPEPPIPPEPGFANLHILGFDKAGGRIMAMPVGGEQGFSALWMIDASTGERIQIHALVEGAHTLAVSPGLSALAMATPGELRVYPLEDLHVPSSRVKLPAGTHTGSLHWSPDGRRLVYLLNEGASPGIAAAPTLGLWLWESEPAQARRLVPLSSEYTTVLGWAPNGCDVLVEIWDGKPVLQYINIPSGRSAPFPIPEAARFLGWPPVALP